MILDNNLFGVSVDSIEQISDDRWFDILFKTVYLLTGEVGFQAADVLCCAVASLYYME